jgi:site-specific DNA-methyltransferase (adenine-specific)
LKAYYQDEWVTIYHGDCREILPQILDKSVDLVLTDPPYGINHKSDWMSQIHLAHGKPACKSDDVLIGDDGSIDLLFLSQYKNRIVWGYPYIQDGNATGWLIWDKQPGLDADMTIGSPVEMCYSTAWTGFRIIRAMWAGYMRDNGEQRFEHPTQKPTKVINYCINKGSKSGDLVLDPFLGSGTTCYCAKKLGRHSIGIEINEAYCEIAAKRCMQSVMQLEIPKEKIEQGSLI